MQAILALRLISDLIIFIFDPTPASGYTVDSQIELFNEVKQNFSKEGQIDILIIFNKKDLAKPSEIEYLRNELNLGEDQFITTNALTGENLDRIISHIKSRYINSD